MVNLPLIEHVAKKNKPLIISTGMSNISEIDEAIETVRSTGNKNLAVLHCNSSYPSTHSEVNLKFMKNLKSLYQIPVGFSDHTTDLLSSKTAIALGADIIERHFTLNKRMEGPDHMLSSDPKELTELIKFKKNYKKFNSWFFKKGKKEKDEINLIVDGIKKIQPNEYITINSQKKFVCKKRYQKNEKFTKLNIAIKGPAGGLLPKYMSVIINKKSKTKIQKDEPITWEKL